MKDFILNKFDKKNNIRTNSALNFFWLGFIIYTLSWVVTTTTYANYIVFQSIQILGLLLFIPNAIRLIQWKFESKYLGFVFSIYCAWQLIVLLRGFQFNYAFLKGQIFDPYEGIFQYLAPLILLFSLKPIYLKKIFYVIVLLSLFFVIYDIFFINDIFQPDSNLTSQAIIEYFSKSLSIPCGFLLLTYPYHSKKRRLLALIIILLTFYLAAIRARRGLMFISINFLVFSYFIYYYNQRIKIITFLLSLLLISSIYLGGLNLFNENKNGMFSYLSERLDEGTTATRDGVEIAFFLDMKPIDWIIGKGINGSYYCPGIDGDRNYRTGIESDYLNIILKGGLISLGLMLLIAIPAIFKGIFYSKNILSKAAGIWILFYIIDIYPTPVTDFTLNYLLVWISIGICYSQTIRNIPESNMKLLLT